MGPKRINAPECSQDSLLFQETSQMGPTAAGVKIALEARNYLFGFKLHAAVGRNSPGAERARHLAPAHRLKHRLGKRFFHSFS